MPLTRIANFTLVSNVRNMVFPIMWADEMAQLDKENADKFISLVLTPTKIVDGVAIGIGMVLGSIMFLAGMSFLLFKKLTKKSDYVFKT
jgi:hypothetical protein